VWKPSFLFVGKTNVLPLDDRCMCERREPRCTGLESNQHFQLRVGHLREGENLEPTFGIAPKPPGYKPGARLSSYVGGKSIEGAARCEHAPAFAESLSPE
jgi:hypothetical protein